MSDEIEALARRFPQHASSDPSAPGARPGLSLDLRRLRRLAQRALKHWEAVGQAAPGRVEEYRQILKELEAEVLAILEACEGQ